MEDFAWYFPLSFGAFRSDLLGGRPFGRLLGFSCGTEETWGCRGVVMTCLGYGGLGLFQRRGCDGQLVPKFSEAFDPVIDLGFLF